jgi:hypothetical protein
METTENNKLIAEFMGLNIITIDDVRKNKNPYISLADGYLEDDLKYHTSWDRLMPVIEKIEGFNEYDVEILQYGTRVLKNSVEIITNVADFSFDKKIEHCYDAIIKFIKEHNEQKQF